MPSLTHIKFAKGNLNYEVNIEFDDQTIIENLISFDVTALVTDSEGMSNSQTLRIEIDWGTQIGRVLHEGSELHKFELRSIDVRIDSQTGEEIIPGLDGESNLNDKVYDHFEEGIGEAVGRLINSMPVPDPFIGCLLKASISSLVGQAITCNEMRKTYGEESGRFWQILKCLKEHLQGIAFRTIWRAARCMLRLGL